MPDDGMLEDLQFEDAIKGFSIAEQFLARRIRAIEKECAKRASCYNVGAITRKQMVAGAGGVTLLSAIVNVLLELIRG